MNFRTIEELNRLIVERISEIPDADLVVGVPRSGMLAASIIATYLNKPLLDINSYEKKMGGWFGNTKKKDNLKSEWEKVEKVIVVEDSIFTGVSIGCIKERLNQIDSGKSHYYIGIYVTSESKGLVDKYFEICEKPRAFEWNYMHNELLNCACVDIDGVLCEDPTLNDNDDGVRYIEFIKSARPKMIPSCTIGWIVTSRLSKYRNETENWLNKNNIKYNELIMMDCTAEERSGNHAEFKASFFRKQRKSLWFIESEPEQAEIIAAISGKLVYCVGNQKVYGANAHHNVIQNKKIVFRKTLKKILPKRVVNWVRIHM